MERLHNAVKLLLDPELIYGSADWAVAWKELEDAFDAI